MSESEASKIVASESSVKSPDGSSGRETIPRVVRICNSKPDEESSTEAAIDESIDEQQPKPENTEDNEDDEDDEDDESVQFESTTTCNGDSCKRLYGILKGISVTTREYLTGQLTQSEAFSRVKQKYSTFKSSRKNEGIFSFKNKLQRGSFLFLIYVFSFIFTLWICYQITLSLIGKPHDVRVIFGLIYLVILNPIFSVLTVMLNIGGTVDNAMNDVSIDSIQTIENALVPCIGSIKSFTKENVCNFHKHFDTENICNSSHVDNGNDNNEDIDLKRRTLLESLSKFFDSQNAFMLKSKNTSVGIKSNTSLDQCLSFLLGRNVEKVLSENVSKSADSVLFNTSSSIRQSIVSALKQIEGENYDNNPIESYERDFVEYLNRDIRRFVDAVIDLIRIDKTKYYTNNNKIRNKPQIESLLSTTIHETSSLNSTAQIDLILGLYLKIQNVLRRLNKTLLPEYSSLRKYIYGDLNIQVQQDLYSITQVTDLYPHVNTIIALVFNNTYFLMYVSTPTESMYTKLTIDVEKFYLSDQPSYETSSSLLFQKCIRFIDSLSKTPLPNDYTVKYSNELKLIKNCIISFVYDSTKNYVRVIQYFTNKINKDGMSSTKDLFIANISKLVHYSYHQNKKRLESLNILTDDDHIVINSGKYISFEEFKIILLNFDAEGMRRYSENVRKAKDDVKTLNDKLGQKEIQLSGVNFSKSYSEMTSLYGILSLLILMNAIHRIYYGTDISFSFVKAATENKA